MKPIYDDSAQLSTASFNENAFDEEYLFNSFIHYSWKEGPTYEHEWMQIVIITLAATTNHPN